MSAEPFEVPLPIVQQAEMRQLAIEAPQVEKNVQATLPTQEHAQAVERAFAHRQQGDDALDNLVVLASAGMLLHDIVADTLAPPEEDEEDDKVTS